MQNGRVPVRLPVYRDDALILRVQKLGESDRIITMLSRRHGRIRAAAADGLHCFGPGGTLTGKLHVPEVVATFTFGGAKRNHVFICASSSLYSILVNFNGARYPR